MKKNYLTRKKKINFDFLKFSIGIIDELKTKSKQSIRLECLAANLFKKVVLRIANLR